MILLQWLVIFILILFGFLLLLALIPFIATYDKMDPKPNPFSYYCKIVKEMYQIPSRFDKLESIVRSTVLNRLAGKEVDSFLMSKIRAMTNEMIHKHAPKIGFKCSTVNFISKETIILTMKDTKKDSDFIIIFSRSTQNYRVYK